jgi:hypothetical protein
MTMSRFFMLATALPLLALAAPAAAQEEIGVARFQQLELVGGGHVTVRHGSVQRVRLLRGSRGISDFAVDRQGRLTIRACRTSCRDYDLRVEIVTPSVEALAIRGGGAIETEGAFPRQGSLAAAVTGGGAIDTRALAPRSVAAAVTGGGSILTDPGASLVAAVRGCGSVT